jgi:glycosyltransferase involved in cell wall biosynthesis
MSRGRVVLVMLNEPFPFGNTNGRWGHALVKGLAERGYQVRCLSVTARAEWAAGARALLNMPGVELSFYPLERDPGLGWLARKWRTARQPRSYSLSAPLRRDLEIELGRGYDVLHLDPLWAGYLALGRARALTGVHNLESIDLQGMRSPSWRARATHALVQRAERRLLSRLRQVHVTTARMAEAVAPLTRAASLHVVPIAVDASLYEFREDDPTTDPVVGFLANMSWPPGHLAAVRMVTRIFPRIRARRPDARLLLVGWNARTALAGHLGTPGLEVIENVPDAAPYFRRLQVFAYPLPLGSGMMAKILEAMAYGVPIVTTTEGAEGYGVKDRIHALVADDDDVFAELVVETLRDADLRRSLRRHARRLVEDSHSPAATGAAMDAVYRTIAG